jgi:hypothetical protein
VNRRLVAVGGTVAGCVAISLGASGVLRRVADLYPTTLPAHPYFVPEHAALLYIAMPIVALATIGMLLAPGFLLVLATGGGDRLGALAARTFGAAFLVRVGLHAALKLAGVEPFGFAAFALTEVTADAALFTLLVARVRRGAAIRLPNHPADRRRALWLVAIPLLAVVLLLPPIFWQDLTDDGLEALEIGRSLATHVVPRFPTTPSGLMGLGIGMLTMAYPNGWFVSLLGPAEAAARLPLALYLPVLFAVLTDLVEWQSPRRLGALAEGTIVLALAAYVVTMVYSASYSAYSADASAPAAFETLTVVCIAATILCAWEGRTGWMLAFALMGYFARPTGMLVLGLLALGTVALAPGERRIQRLRLGAAIAACLAAFVLYERIYMPHAAHGLASGYATGSILDRLRFLTFTQARRALYLAVPGGVLPALAMLAWRRQDPFARQLTVFCALYFLFFYPQAFLALHHFVPVMILPIVVYWRLALSGDARWPVPAAAVAAAASLVLSLPRSFAVDRTMRAIGRATDYRLGDYLGDWAASRAALRNRRALRLLFRPEWEVADPSRELVSAPIGIVYYATRFPKTAADTVNYVAQPADAPPPAGFTLVGADGTTEAYVRDLDRWRRDRYSPPRTDYRARVYDIPRATLHRFIGIPAGAYQVDLRALPGLWRLFR